MPVGTGADWALNGMETGFFASSSDRKFIYQSTLVIEKDITKRLFAFVEYVGNFPSDGGNNQFINSGAGYLIDDRQQIDFHVGFGLDRNAPSYFFGLGYSFRIDGVLQRSCLNAPARSHAAAQSRYEMIAAS